MIHRLPALLLALLLPISTAAAQATPTPDLAELRAAVQADAQDGPAWYALGRALQEAGEHAAALEAFDRALALGHWEAGALLRGAQSAAALGRREDALARVQRVAAEHPQMVSLLQQIPVGALAGDPRYEKVLADAFAQRYPCRGEGRHRDFDFWLGQWQVTDPSGSVVGHNTISADLEGCVVREAWTDAAGGRGSSVNFYDPHTRRWHQVWTSDRGTVTHYVGGFEEGAMRFHAEGFGDVDGRTRQRRMVYTPGPDGSVRQLIEDSEDGEHWTVGFDGTYRRVQTSD